MADRRYIKTGTGTCYKVPDSYTSPIPVCFSDTDANNNGFVVDAGCTGFDRANNVNCSPIPIPVPIPVSPTPAPITPTPVAPVPVPITPIPVYVPTQTCVLPDFTLSFNSSSGYINISGNTTGTYYQYSAGETFNAGAAYNGTILPGAGALIFPVVNSRYYTVRVYNQNSSCFTEKVIDTTIVVIPCGESLTLEVRYDENSANRKFITVPGGKEKTIEEHFCNSAKFDVSLNGISIGVANLNNRGGTPGSSSCDDIGPSNTRTRYATFSISSTQLSIIASTNVYKRITYRLTCLVFPDIDCSEWVPWGKGKCHKDVNRVIIRNQSGRVIYDDLPSGNVFEFYYGC